MRRNRERFDRPEKECPEFISGCRQFEGEDLNHHTRKADDAATQKMWVEQQKREAKDEANRNKQEDADYAAQTDAITRMRGMLEDEATQKKAMMMKQMQEENKRAAQAKRDRENAWKNNQEAQNSFEIGKTMGSDFMTENPATTVSGHADHRYRAEHFKGLRPDQVEEINAARAQQVREAKEQKNFEKMEQTAWAAQQAANHAYALQNEVEMQERYNAMQKNLQSNHKEEKVAKDARWPNMYGDLNAQPEVSKNMDEKSMTYLSHAK